MFGLMTKKKHEKKMQQARDIMMEYHGVIDDLENTFEDWETGWSNLSDEQKNTIKQLQVFSRLRQATLGRQYMKF